MRFSNCMVNLVLLKLICILVDVECNQRYIVSLEPVNWYQALINCKNAGMELASIHSEEEKKRLEKFMKENGHDRGYWLAGTREGNGEFYWATTGTKLGYTNWLDGQPDDANLDYNSFEGENCIQWGLPTSSPDPIGWNDFGCTKALPYICQNYEGCHESFDEL